jgi:hypothetical protein
MLSDIAGGHPSNLSTSSQGVFMRARFTVGLALGTLLLSCSDRSAPLAPDGVASDIPATLSSTAASQIAQLRRLVAPFHDFQTAVRAGWSAPITPCLVAADLPSQPGAGAMGFHYGNLAFIQDKGVVNLLQPELLLYEPEKNGKLRFVGVEYIVPFTDIPSTADAPTLLGQRFGRVPEFGVWGLHIWVGRHNPSGIFTPWNPKVSCANAPASQVARVTHHHGN